MGEVRQMIDSVLKAKKLSRTKLAECLGINRRTMYTWEKNNKIPPKYLITITSFLNNVEPKMENKASVRRLIRKESPKVNKVESKILTKPEEIKEVLKDYIINKYRNNEVSYFDIAYEIKQFYDKEIKKGTIHEPLRDALHELNYQKIVTKEPIKGSRASRFKLLPIQSHNIKTVDDILSPIKDNIAELKYDFTAAKKEVNNLDIELNSIMIELARVSNEKREFKTRLRIIEIAMGLVASGVFVYFILGGL